MRRLLNVLATACLMVGLMALAVHARSTGRERAEAQSAALSVSAINARVKVLSLTGKVPLNGRGYPTRLEAAWFDRPVPRNTLLSGDHPWLEIAPESEAELEHPREVVANRPEQAGLWYNPSLGIVRARVPPQASDEKATELYNRVNGTAVVSVMSAWTEGRIGQSAPKDPRPPRRDPLHAGISAAGE